MMKLVYFVEKHKQMPAICCAESVESVIVFIILVLQVILFNFEHVFVHMCL